MKYKEYIDYYVGDDTHYDLPSAIAMTIKSQETEGWQFVSVFSRPIKKELRLGDSSINIVTGSTYHILFGRTELGNVLYNK